jgi:hypothetical protein
VRELFDRPCARRQFVSVDEHDEAVVGGGEYYRDTIPVRSAHVGRLIVAMVRIERHRNAPTEDCPGRALAQEPVGDVAQRAMGAAESSADKVDQLTYMPTIRRI